MEEFDYHSEGDDESDDGQLEGMERASFIFWSLFWIVIIVIFSLYSFGIITL